MSEFLSYNSLHIKFFHIADNNYNYIVFNKTALKNIYEKWELLPPLPPPPPPTPWYITHGVRILHIAV